MKKLALLSLFLLSTVATTYAQVVAPWTPFPVDAVVTLRVPGKPRPVQVPRYDAEMPTGKQLQGYQYDDAMGSFILLRMEKPMDRLYAVDSNPDFYDHQIDKALRVMHGTLAEEAMLLNGPYRARCARFTVPGHGMQYMMALLVHGISYQCQYLPNRPLSKDQDAKVWAQLLESIVSVK